MADYDLGSSNYTSDKKRDKDKKKKKKEPEVDPEAMAEAELEAELDAQDAGRKKKSKDFDPEADAEEQMAAEDAAAGDDGKKKKKKKSSKTSALEDLETDVGPSKPAVVEEEAVEEDEEDEEERKRKKKEKKERKRREAEEAAAAAAAAAEAAGEAQPDEAVPVEVIEESTEKKKKKKKKQSEEVADEEVVVDVEMAPTEETAEAAEAGADGTEKKKKKKKKAKEADAEDWEQQLDADQAAVAEQVEEPEAQDDGKKKKKKKKQAEEVEEARAALEALEVEEQAEVAEPVDDWEAEAIAAEAAPAADKKKKKGGKKDKPVQDDVDLDELLQSKQEAENGDDAGDDVAESGQALTKAQLKRLRKKETASDPAKEAAAAAEKKRREEEKLKKEEAEKAKKKAAVPAHIRAMQEAQAKLKEAEERAKKEAEERARLEAEEEARLAAEAKAKKEAELRRLEEQKRKREEMKKAGLLVSEKERARQKANQAALQAMIASGQVKVSALPRAGEEAMAAVAAGPKKFSYGKKKPEVKKPITADKPSEEQKKAQEAAVAAVQAEASSSEESDSDSESESDSDSSSSDSDSTSSEESSSEEEEEVPDSWEDDVATPVAPKPAKVAAPVAAAVPDSWDDEVPDSWEEADSAPVAAVKPGAVSAAEIAAAAPKVEKPKEKTKEPKEKTKEPKEKSEHKEKKSEDKKAKEESKKDAPAPAVAAPVSAPSAVVAKPAESKTEVVASKDSKKKDSKRELRSPICCILGHVDTGKTKILDRIRHTNVQNMEAGGITQQIGATFVPVEAIQKQTELLMSQQKRELDFQLPGLLIIDTPGHESFSNLRSRGSGLCDIAVLVIDLMHGLEPQTIESINLLKMRKTPFIVALNKVDRCFGWNPNPDSPFQSSFAKQPQSAQAEFEQRTRDVKLQLNEQGLNCELYFRNQDFRKYVSLVPTSAITGEGIPDLLMLITQLTQTMMGERLGYQNELQCTILEVKMTDGIGYTIDVILVNGVLKVGDTIVLCGMQGPIVTKIRTLMTPQPLREMRVKNEYTTHTEVRAAMGVKISAHELEHAVSGSQLIVCNNPSNLEMYKDEVMADLASIVSKVSKTERGLYVQASTLGSLEALLSFLQGHKIPVAAVGIGPIHKKDVMKAGVMLERAPEYATILAFDVKITPDARDLAETMGVRIFTAEIIYHLFDQFTKYMEEVKTQKRADAGNDAVFPCVLEILPNCVFNMRDPLIVGVLVKDGVVKVGTPLCVPTKKFIDLGRVVSIEDNHVPMQVAKKGAKVCIRVELDNKFDSQPNFNRHYDITDNLVSKMSRRSIDLLKANYKDDLNQQEWMLVVKLKKVFEIM